MDRLREVGEAKGNKKPPPSWKLEEPPLIEGATFYLGAFHALSTERPLGANGVGRIPFSRVVWFAGRMQLAPDVTEQFLAVISAMDAAFMEYQHEIALQMKADAEAAAHAASSPTGRQRRR